MVYKYCLLNNSLYLNLSHTDIFLFLICCRVVQLRLVYQDPTDRYTGCFKKNNLISDNYI